MPEEKRLLPEIVNAYKGRFHKGLSTTAEAALSADAMVCVLRISEAGPQWTALAARSRTGDTWEAIDFLARYQDLLRLEGLFPEDTDAAR